MASELEALDLPSVDGADTAPPAAVKSAGMS
jgi:hypothetical protein